MSGRRLCSCVFGLLVAVVLTGSGVARSATARVPGGDGAVGQSASRRMPGDLATGTLLVAARQLGDRTFGQTVVLLFSYSKDGAAGLIVNQRTQVKVRDVLPDLPIPKGPEPVTFFGGPVSRGDIRGLLHAPAVRSDAYRILPDVSLIATSEALLQAIAEGATANRLRLYAGYAGWGAGQLEGEVLRGDWIVTAGDGAVVFDTTPETLWRREIRRTDVLTL